MGVEVRSGKQTGKLDFGEKIGCLAVEVGGGFQPGQRPRGVKQRI